jgi:hypothetical protein
MGSAWCRRLTLPSRGRPTSGFACCRPPLMSNVRALRMPSFVFNRRAVKPSQLPLARCAALHVFAGEPRCHSSRLGSSAHIGVVFYRICSGFSSARAKPGRLPGSASQSCASSTGQLAPFSVSPLSRFAAGCLVPVSSSRRRRCRVSAQGALGSIVPRQGQRPNPTVERTPNGKAHFQCALPSVAAHLRR